MISPMATPYPSSLNSTGKKKTPTKFLLVVILLLIAAGAYVVGSGDFLDSVKKLGGKSFDTSKPLKIVAATELTDLEPFVHQASAHLGFDIEMEYDSGTLVNTRNLNDGAYGAKHDATWFATNAFARAQGTTSQAEEHSIARSPIALGLKQDVVDRLGWRNKDIKWADIADAAARGDLSFGMTDPQESNSGFLALLSVAAEFSDFTPGQAFDSSRAPMDERRMEDFFSGQTITSGSSGWLRDTFVKNPGKADGIFNYQAVLQSMKENDGVDIEVFVPGNFAGAADYPIAALRKPGDDKAEEDAQAKVEALADWFREHSVEVGEKTHLSVWGEDAENKGIHRYYEYPKSEDQIVSLVSLYRDKLRRPADSNFLLDTSGSMRGNRLADLKNILNKLIDGTAGEGDNPKGFARRETITLMPFSSKVADGYTQENYDPDDARQKQDLRGYVNGLQPRGETAIYDAVLRAYDRVGEGGGSLNSIVLMTDGESNSGTSRQDFITKMTRIMGETNQKIPVFVILYGEASEEEMNFLANFTGGKVFNARGGDLAKAFEEIRSYQ